jgi:hypothetical protein
VPAPAAQAELAAKVEPAAKTESASKAEPKSATAECAACSTVNDPDAVFCKKCGARMANEAAS